MTVRTIPEQRCRFYELHQQGVTYAEVADQYGLSKECIRYWCRRQRDGHGCETRSLRKQRGLLSQFDPKVRFVILRLRLEHPRWGPNRILNRLRKRASLRGLRLPREASIGRYLHQWRRFRRKPKKKAERSSHAVPNNVHACWQVDFKVGIQLADGTRVNLHTVRDPLGEVCIGACVFSTGKRQRRIKLEEVRAVLRQCFQRWKTLPQIIQTDGEPVLITPNPDPFPSDFILWLKGLGIEHQLIHNVTSNAEVERCHRTIHDYAVVGNENQTVAALQTILDQSLDELNYELPSRAGGCQGRPPILAHPELLRPRRPFEPQWEWAFFDLQRVDDFLASQSWKRIVHSNGAVPLGGKRRRYSLGRRYARQEVEVRFDPADRHFVFALCSAPHLPIKRLPAKRLDRNALTGMAAWPIGPGVQQLPLPLFQAGGVYC